MKTLQKALSRYNFRLLVIFIIPFWLLIYALIPVFQSPDEPGHYASIQAFANGHFPTLPQTQSNPSSREADSFANIYRSQDMIFNQQNTAYPKRQGDISKNDFVTSSVQAYHPPVYALTATLIYKTVSFFNFSGVERYNMVRLTSFFYYTVFLFAIFSTFKLLFDKKSAFYLALALGLQPVVLLLFVNINPEAAAVSLSAFTFYLTTKLFYKKEVKLSDFVILGIFTGLTILGKVSGVILLPSVAFTIFFLLKSKVLEKIKYLFAYGFTSLLIVLPWLAVNYSIYKRPIVDNFKFDITSQHFGPYTFFSLIVRIVNDLKTSLAQIRGVFGWVDTPTPTIFGIFYLSLVFALLGIGVFLVLKHKFKNENSSAKLVNFALISSFFTFAFLTTISFYIQITYFRVGLLGRYFFIGVLPIAILVFFALNKIFPYKNTNTAKYAFLFSTTYYLIILVFSLIPRYYV